MRQLVQKSYRDTSRRSPTLVFTVENHFKCISVQIGSGRSFEMRSSSVRGRQSLRIWWCRPYDDSCAPADESRGTRSKAAALLSLQQLLRKNPKFLYTAIATQLPQEVTVQCPNREAEGTQRSNLLTREYLSSTSTLMKAFKLRAALRKSFVVTK